MFVFYVSLHHTYVELLLINVEFVSVTIATAKERVQKGWLCEDVRIPPVLTGGCLRIASFVLQEPKGLRKGVGDYRLLLVAAMALTCI